MRYLLRGLATPWIALGLGLLTYGLMAWLHTTSQPMVGPEAPGVIALELVFSKRNALHVLEAWAHPEQFPSHTGVDFFFAVAYAGFLASLLALPTFWRTRREPGGLELAAIVTPFLAGALDWLENGLLLQINAQRADVAEWVVVLMSCVSAVKWLLAFVAILAIPVLAVRRWRGAAEPAAPSA